MSASADSSHLSDPRYGYNLVVATTQKSINATMKKYLNSLENAETSFCVIYDENLNLQIIDLQELIKKANGADPFAIPTGEDPKSERLKALDNAGLAAAIKVTLGLPSNFDDPRTLPDIIDLDSGASKVTYNMTCADLHIVELLSTRGKIKWTSWRQNEVQNRASIFKASVDLRLDVTSKFGTLPQAVQDSIKNLGGDMFSVQQLLFDLSNARLQDVPTISGVDLDNTTIDFIQKYFITSYFGHMKEQGQPVLNYVVTHKPQNATLKPTDLNFHSSPLSQVVDKGVKTLDYLCATDGVKLPPAVDFTWDWVSPQDAAQYHGIIAINRLTFAKYLHEQLYAETKRDCFIPKAKVDTSSFNCWGGGEPDSITVEMATTGDTILKYSWSAEAYDEAGIDGAIGRLRLRQDYTRTVQCTGNRIVIVSHQKIHLYVRSLQTPNEADIVDKTITDTLELGVDGHGRMVQPVKTTDIKDDSKSDSAGGFVDFFTDVNAIFNHFKDRKFTSTDLKSVDIQQLQNFVFPGGETFAFKGVHFSNFQDLLVAISYADPS